MREKSEKRQGGGGGNIYIYITYNKVEEGREERERESERLSDACISNGKKGICRCKQLSIRSENTRTILYGTASEPHHCLNNHLLPE